MENKSVDLKHERQGGGRRRRMGRVTGPTHWIETPRDGE